MPRGRKVGSKNKTNSITFDSVNIDKVAKIVLEYKNISDAQEILNKRYLDHQSIITMLNPNEFKLYFEGAR